MTASVDYRLPSNATTRLDQMVDDIEARPGAFVSVQEFLEAEATVDMRRVAQGLPEGLSQENFVDILRLALLTECATESYAAVFSASARQFNAPWMGRFIENVWVPDELSHHAPYKLLLLKMGYPEEQMLREIKETQEKHYVHHCGDTPIQLTTFGVVQEYLTDNWHGLIANMIEESAPVASRAILQVKRRETLHTAWYRDMTGVQIEGNPKLLPLVAESIVKFRMPSNVLVPELQNQARSWMPYMNADFERMLKDLVRLVHQISGDASRMARLLVYIAATSRHTAGPIPVRTLKRIIDRLGGTGYGLIGEAILHRMDLDRLYQPERQRRIPVYTTAYDRVRGMLRDWISRMIDVRLDVVQA